MLEGGRIGDIETRREKVVRLYALVVGFLGFGGRSKYEREKTRGKKDLTKLKEYIV